MQRHSDEFELEDRLPAIRDRLVRLCERLSGDADAAEDLAQETLLEAWRHAHKLYDPTGYTAWLWAIARNVCLRQGRQRGRDLAYLSRDSLEQAADWASDDTELEIDLEREELATLLDQALALLPPTTRTVLVERYIQESPQAEVAARLGLSEGAVAVRLHRGKLALRRLLNTQLQNEVATYGLPDATSEWQATRIWCPVCGHHRLLTRLSDTEASVAFRCPGCQPNPTIPGSEYRLANAHFARLIGGLTQPRAVLNRTAAWVHAYYRRALDEGGALCTNCGRPTPLRRLAEGDNPPHLTDRHGLYLICEACGESVLTSFKGLVQALPAVHQFWRQHGRVRTLPDRAIEIDGRPALVSHFESVTSSAALDVISVRDTYAVIAIHPTPGAAGS